MNKKGVRNTNGEGSIYDTIEKHKRKKFLKEECSICKNCKNKCNRSAFEKCEKCENCKEECLKYCDRFYCYKKSYAQITINGKQTTVGNANKKREAVEKKKEAEAKVQTKNYIKKNGVKILEIIKKVDSEKHKKGKIGDNTKSRNKYLYKHIENSILNDVPIQKITPEMVDDFLNSLKHLSNSEIDKVYHKLKSGFERAVLDKIIAYADNPMLRIDKPLSEKEDKIIEAFEIHEQIILMEYVASHNLVKNSKCDYNEKTLKNLILLDLLTAMRIGELGALNYITDVDFTKSCFIIHSSLTKDENEKITKGKHTKTGKKKIQIGEIDQREVPFDIFDKNLCISILKEQIQIAQNNPNNKEHLLFCKKNGNYINHSQITTIFKRICRETKIKLHIPQGCHIHMCRHTAITRMLEAHIDLMVIAKMVGHSDTRQIQKTYGHILNKFKKEELQRSQRHYAKNNLFTIKLQKSLKRKEA